MTEKLAIAAMPEFTAPECAKFDLYLLAAIRTGFREYACADGNQESFAVGFTLEAAAGKSAEAIDFVKDCFADRKRGRLTEAHLKSLERGTTAFVTADVTPELLQQLASSDWVREVQLCANLAPNRPVPRRVRQAGLGSDAAAPPLSDKTRILGLIDHGCPFAHRALLKGRKTRVFAIWDQDEVPDFPADVGRTPTGFGYGRQVDAAALNRFIEGARSGRHIDEDHCYRLAQYTAVQSEATHGSMVLGLLASKWRSRSLGDGRPFPRQEAALNAALVFVQLPRDVPLAPCRGSVDRCTLDGVQYILDCAPDGAHVVIVIDYGTEMGPHDGSSWFERALDCLVAQASWERQITLDLVFPSGNSHELKRHAVVFHEACAAGESATLGWCIPRANDTPATIELWTEADAGFQLCVSPPGGAKAVIRLSGKGDGLQAWPEDGTPVCVAVSREIGKQRQILIQAAPTTEHADFRAPAGVWKLAFETAADKVPPVWVYCCWGGRGPGLTQRVWPARLVPLGSQPNIHVAGEGTITGSGCGQWTWMVGGHEHWGSAKRAVYSSGGEARDGKRKKPVNGADLLAPTEESPTLPGLLTMGTRSATLVRARGTSFGAPQLARKLIWGYRPVEPTVNRPAPAEPGRAGSFGPPALHVPRHSIEPRAEYSEPRLA